MDQVPYGGRGQEAHWPPPFDHHFLVQRSIGGPLDHWPFKREKRDEILHLLWWVEVVAGTDADADACACVQRTQGVYYDSRSTTVGVKRVSSI